MDIYTRKDWGAKPPKEPRSAMRLPAEGTYIHHTVTGLPTNYPTAKPSAQIAMEKAHMQQLQSIAFSRDFNDISYSFVIFPSGRVYKGRGWGVVGAHTEGSNSITHAFVFVGNFESVRPTKDALEAAAALHRRGVRAGKIRKTGFIRGHRDAPGAATACPGIHLYNRLEFIRREAKG